MKSYTLHAFASDEMTVLPRIVGACSRRRVKIESIFVKDGRGERACYTITLKSDPELVGKLCRQLEKIVEVGQVLFEEV